MFWKESMSEGVISGLLGLAGRRRGLEAAEDMLAERDRGDVPIDSRIGEGGPWAELANMQACRLLGR